MAHTPAHTGEFDVGRFFEDVPARQADPNRFLRFLEAAGREQARVRGDVPGFAPTESPASRALQRVIQPAIRAQRRAEAAQGGQIRTLGQLRQVAQALKGIPADMQSRIISRLTGIPATDPGLAGLGRILFREQLRAPREARREAVRERRFEAAQRERRLAREETRAHREATREFQERQFRARQEEDEAEVLKALDDLVQLRERFRQTGRQDAVSALNEVEVRLLLRLIKPRARITKEE